MSRTGRNHAARFREVADAIRRLPATSLILDGEVARFGKQLVSRFHLLHEETGELATPPVFVAFDCLWSRGRHLRQAPLGDRRLVLEREIRDDATVTVPARRLNADGLKAWQQVVERGYEGLVAKDERSHYVSGPTTSWLKVKVRHEGRFLVGGIVDHADEFGGLLVGERVGGALLYRGTVEWGFTGPRG